MPESLRDAVESAFDSVIETPAEPAAPAEAAPAPQEPAPKEDRARDEQGRFVAQPGDKKKEAAPQAAKPPVEPTQPPPVAETAKPRYQRPSTWRKETWGVWDKLNSGQPLTPEEIHLMAEEAIKRDADFANGVSTYKREWESAKPLIDAIAPFMPVLQQYGIQPNQWITNLGNAHRMLALGSPQEKASRFVQLAREYGVPLEQLFTLGQDGRLYINQNIAQQQPQQPDIGALVEQKLREREQQQLDRQAETEIAAMERQQDKYPHLQEVRETMAGLLQAGLADDLPGAYEAALRHPRHSALYEAQQQQQRQLEEQARAETARKAAEAARRKASGVRTASPTSAANAGDKKGLRSVIEEAFDSSVSGRV